jgi:DNA-binding IclR family transcriptional regulator
VPDVSAQHADKERREVLSAVTEAVPTSSNHSQTLSRGIQMLEILAEANSGVSIADLSKSLGVHRSIAYRILRTLEDHGLVTRSDAGVVSLGSRMVYLARNVASTLRATALPELVEAANDLGVTCFMSVLDRAECITLVSAEPTTATAAVVQRPGSRHSVAVGAPGLAIQSILTQPQWQAILPEESRRPELGSIRECGYATSHDEVIAGVSSVAVPLQIAGEGPAAIAAVFVTGAVDLAVIAERLQLAVARIAPRSR